MKFWFGQPLTWGAWWWASLHPSKQGKALQNFHDVEEYIYRSLDGQAWVPTKRN